MATVRSPNYPSLSLGEAIDAIRPVLRAEHRSKMSRHVLAEHLGYSSISGRALSKMGAIRAYGLIEGQGDETRVSHDGLICVEAPEGSPDRREALLRCATRPAVFSEISKEFQSVPSESNLRYWLVKKGFIPEAARKIVQTYLDTMRLVGPTDNPYNPGEDTDTEESDVEAVAVAPKAPAQRTEADTATPAGMRKFVINLPDGKDATLTYPADLDGTGYDDLKDYLDLFFKKAKRGDPSPGSGDSH